jgi:predicted DCC family thiol-disulfide oxidoreductase YuxK
VSLGKEHIVFYDGECGFCNRTVQWILEKERSPVIHFSAIQSPFAQRFLKGNGVIPDLSTVYFYSEGQLYSESAAAFQLCLFLRNPYRSLRFFRVLPRTLTNAVYRWVAKRRHRMASGYCIMPTTAQKERFIAE